VKDQICEAVNVSHIKFVVLFITSGECSIQKHRISNYGDIIVHTLVQLAELPSAPPSYNYQV